MALSTVWAQSTGTIQGTVRDSTGAVVPNTTITVRSLETGLVRTASSGANGAYRIAALPVGSYEVRAEQMGFQTEVHSSVGLTVGQEAVVNFSLQVGAVEQTIEVTGEAPLVNTTSGTIGALVDENQVSELPLNGRNYINLTLLQPGVVQHRTTTLALSSVGTWMVINGAPPRSNFFLMDGAPMNNYGDASTSSVGANTLGVEAIREWRVVTRSYSAEYGMRMGGQMVIVTKGGTNEFHGSLFENFRNSALDARNFFDYKTEAFGGRLPPFRRNQYGGSLGGPILQDKLFFFVTYEGLKERVGQTIITNTIGAGCQAGAGGVVTNTACPQLGSTASVTVSPVMAPLLALYPAPNLPGNRLTFPFTQPTDEHYGMIRGDVNPTANDSLFVRYTIDDATKKEPVLFPQFSRLAASRSQFLTVSDSHTFGSSVVGTFRFSVSKPDIGQTRPTDVTAPGTSFLPGLPMGAISITGLSQLGPETNTPSINNLKAFSYSADLFYSRGNHNLKFGTLINQYRPFDLGNGSGVFGAMSFSNVANFMQGIATSYGGGSQTPDANGKLVYTDLRHWLYNVNTAGFYFQDDLRLLSNLTLNLGLRYEFATVPDEVDGRESSLRDIVRDTEFTVGPAFKNPSLKNFSPRFGFAWDVRGDGKTAVRGGFAVLFDTGAYGQLLNLAGNLKQPFSVSGPSVSSTEFPQYTTITALPFVFAPDVVNAVGASTMDYNIQNPHMLSYSLTVERELPFDMGLSLGYAGSRGINLIQNKSMNPRPHTVLSDGRFFWAGNEKRVNPAWESIAQYTAGVSSWYNALQFSLTKRASQGLQFQSSYTWSKLLDERPGQTGPDGGGSGSIATVTLPRQLDKGPGEADIAHTWRFNTIYHLPQAALSGIGGTLLNGWWVGGILSAQTGLPFTVTTGGSDRSRSLGAGNLPDLNPGRWNPNIISGTTEGCAGVAPGQKLGTPDLYFDPCAFSLEPLGFLGNQGRNILTGPGEVTMDFSLVKDTKLGFLGEAGNVQFRAEVFNLLNRANFMWPSRGVFSAPSATVVSTAGEITRTSTSPRQVQFSLKVAW
jgi:hypothetical protein